MISEKLNTIITKHVNVTSCEKIKIIRSCIKFLLLKAVFFSLRDILYILTMYIFPNAHLNSQSPKSNLSTISNVNIRKTCSGQIVLNYQRRTSSGSLPGSPTKIKVNGSFQSNSSTLQFFIMCNCYYIIVFILYTLHLSRFTVFHFSIIIIKAVVWFLAFVY